MAEIIKQIEADVGKKNTFSKIVAKQGDTSSRFLRVTIANEGVFVPITSNSTVVINAERSDGEKNAFFGEVNEDGTVKVPLASWILAKDGEAKCSISVIDTEERKLTTTSFIIEIEYAEYTGEDAQEDEDYDVLVSLITEVRGIQTAEESRVIAENARVSAEALRKSATQTAIANAETAAQNANDAADRIEDIVGDINNALDAILGV